MLTNHKTIRFWLLRRIKAISPIKLRTIGIETQGSVTAFFMLIVGGLLMLFLMVYNYGLYSFAVQQFEDGLQASLSSVLADYDPAIMRELGLFALRKNEAQTVIGRDYLQSNLSSAGASMQMTLQEYQLTYDQASSLSRPENINQQIILQEAYDGWLSMGSALLDFLEINPFPQSLAAAPVSLENDLDTDAEGLSLWQLLSPWPVQGWTLHNLQSVQETTDQEGQMEQKKTAATTLVDPALKNGQAFQGFAARFKIQLKDALLAGKEHLLRCAYVMQQFDYMTAKAVRQRYFTKSEVEYILWGAASDWSNVRQMAFHLFLLRTVLHCTYEFCRSPAAEPAARLGAAVLNGISQGKADVEALYRGEKIAAFPGQTKLKMSYQDHLRLFLLLQSKEEQLKRLQNLLGANIGYWDRCSAHDDSNSKLKDPEQQIEAPGLDIFYTKIRVKALIRLTLWPLGNLDLMRQGEQGYDCPFVLIK